MQKFTSHEKMMDFELELLILQLSVLIGMLDYRLFTIKLKVLPAMIDNQYFLSENVQPIDLHITVTAVTA